MFEDFAARLIAKSDDFGNLLLAVEKFPFKITLLLRCAMLPGCLKNYGAFRSFCGFDVCMYMALF